MDPVSYNSLNSSVGADNPQLDMDLFPAPLL